MSSVSMLLNSVVVTAAGGAQVPGSIGISSDHTIMTLFPSSLLAPNTSYTVSVSGVQDVSGNVAPPFSSGFSTGTTTVTARPSVTLVDPVNGAAGVETNALIRLQFSERIDPVSVNNGTIQVWPNSTGVPISGTATASADGLSATFFTSAVLPSTAITVRVNTSGITDLAGNGINFFQSGFTTGTAPDTIPPTGVLFVSPQDGAAGVPLNARISVQFSEPMSSVSMLLNSVVVTAAGGAQVPGSIGISSDHTIMTLFPSSLLAPNTSYTVSVSGVQDVSGNVAPPFSSGFSTGTTTVTARPSVTLVDPANGATGVETNALIRLQFSERIDPVSVNNGTIQVWPNSTGVPISGTATASADGLSATFFTSALLPSTAYTVRVNTSGIADLAGNGVNFFQSGFTTGTASDTDVPTGIIFVSPQDGAAGVPVNARISVQFSEPMSSVSMLSNPVTVIAAGGATVAGSIGISSDHTAMTLFPSSPLAPSTSYTVHVSGVQDVSGSVAPPFTSSFTTAASTAADLIRPSVISVSPANGAGGVAANSTVVWTFSEPVDPTTVNINNIFVFVNNTGVHVAGTYAVNGAVVRFTPATSFVNSTGFSTQVNGGVLDLAGNTANFIQTSFTTAGPSSSITNAPPPLRPVNATLDSTNPLSTGLMGLFLMNEGNGSTDKNLVNSKLAAFAGTNVPTWNFADPSMVFNGGGSLASYLDAGTDLAFDQLPTSQITIVAKIFVNQVAAAGVCEKNDNNITDSGFVFGWDSSGSLRLTVEKSTQDMRVASATGVIPAGQWIQVAFTWDGTSGVSSAAHLFFNAVELPKASASDGSGILGFANATNQPFRIGNVTFDPMAGALNGKMAYLAVYRGRILSTGEMVQLDGQLPIK